MIRLKKNCLYGSYILESCDNGMIALIGDTSFDGNAGNVYMLFDNMAEFTKYCNNSPYNETLVFAGIRNGYFRVEFDL